MKKILKINCFFVTNSEGPGLSDPEKLDILVVYFTINRDHLLSTTNSKTINAVACTAELLGRSKGTVSTIVKNWADMYDEYKTDIGKLKTAVRSFQN